MKVQPNQISAAFIALVIFTACFSITSCQNKEQDPINEYISSEGDSLLSNPEIKSISIGVIKNGKIYKLHKGQLANGKPPNDQTLYEIASLTKTFTGTLLAQAIVAKKVKIDDDIRKYLSDSLPKLVYDKKPITFRHLVTHTSGLPHMFPYKPDIFDNPDWDKLPFEIYKLQEGFTKSQFFDELQKVKLDTIPGFKFNYSNVGANLVGYCLENIYGKSYRDLLSEYILKSLQMTETKIEISGDGTEFLAQGFNANHVKMPARAEKEMNAEGGIVSTLDDMIKYMEFHLNEDNPVAKLSHQGLLDGRYGDFENGLFWQIFKDGEKPDKIFQNGGAFGTSSWMTIVPETKIGVFIVTNVSGPKVHQKLSVTVDNILKELN